MTRVRIAILLAVTVSCAARGGAKPAGSNPHPPESPALGRVLETLAKHPLDEAWPAIEALRPEFQSLDEAAAAALAGDLDRRGERAKLAAAVLLTGRRERPLQQLGQIALQQIARDGREKDVRIAAIRLLRSPALPETARLALSSLADHASDPELIIAAAASLWTLDQHPAARPHLLKLLAAPDPAVRRQAALALGETGYLEPPVGVLLEAMRKEPTPNGMRADLVLRTVLPNRERAAEPPAPGNGSGADSWPALMAEAIAVIQKNSLNGEQMSLRSLYIAALKGMAASLDEYSLFQDPEEVRRLEANQLGVQWGLGATLVKPAKDAPLVVARLNYDGPAYRKGIRTADRILEVNGITTHDHDPEEIRRLTAESEAFLLSVLRWGWSAPRPIAVERGQVQVPLIRAEVFPGKIGYLKLLRFVPRSSTDFARHLEGLEARGIEALIFDLRDNPGGRLDEAVAVADLFLGEAERPIVTVLGVDGSRQDHFATAGEKPRWPLCILANRFSASSAEVVAGSLQDFGRATIIGEPTRGKGVAQVQFPLTSPNAKSLLGGESRLVLTTSRIILPLGRTLEPGNAGRAPSRGGIVPDIRVEPTKESFQGSQLSELTKVQFSPQVTEYIHRHYASIKHLFEEGDLWDPRKYPGFEDLYASLDTALRRDDVRFALRNLIRRHLEDEKGEEFVSDYQDDNQLQRAILEALHRLGRDPRAIAEYRALAEKHGVPAVNGARE
jgi:carboxyl-terminal processing protease